MQINAYLHRYSVSPSGFSPRPTKGIFVPSKIAVLKIAAFHCSFGVINSTNMHPSNNYTINDFASFRNMIQAV